MSDSVRVNDTKSSYTSPPALDAPVAFDRYAGSVSLTASSVDTSPCVSTDTIVCCSSSTATQSPWSSQWFRCWQLPTSTATASTKLSSGS